MAIRTARCAADLLEPLFQDAAEEKVAILHLDSERRMIALVEEAPGGEGQVELPVRSILATGLRLGAAGMVIAHNHPSGDPRPSAEDVRATRVLAASARAVGICLHDHLIFAGGECRSFRQLGLL
jgi:DNA repair protein RadC